MTIAACYVSREGVVFGADSTTTFDVKPQQHYFNHAQKIFEIGDPGTFALVTWGLGTLRTTSYRTFAAVLAEGITTAPPANVEEVANRWIELLWPDYEAANSSRITRAQELLAKKDSRTEEETAELFQLGDWHAGFCIGGYCPKDRHAQAFETSFDVTQAKPKPEEIQPYIPTFWGAPNLAERLIYGIDWRLFNRIARSDKWTGSRLDLIDLVRNYALATPELPMREAIDFVHASIYSTIKGLKFSRYPQTCGGPIEIAAITTDRRFRWVRHKSMDEAIKEQEGYRG